MYKILVVDDSALDREMTEKTLTEHLENPVDIGLADSGYGAYQMVKEKDYDLIIIDVLNSTAYVKNLVSTAYTLNHSINIILTSVKQGSEIAQLAHKLGVFGYLLKPYKRESLIDMVRSLEISVRRHDSKTEENTHEKCLSNLRASIQDCQYKKSIETAKEYLDFLYASDDNINMIRMRIVEFIGELGSLYTVQNQDVKNKLTHSVNRFRTRYDLQGSRFEAANVAEEIIDLHFSELESNQVYQDDSMKKVLNYINRNIKRGITLDSAAEYVNMSSSYFSRFFKKYTGTNFITYVTERKIEYAKEMLENTNMPIINIAYELSYNDTNYFSKAFKRKVGISPTEYRDQFFDLKSEARN